MSRRNVAQVTDPVRGLWRRTGAVGLVMLMLTATVFCVDAAADDPIDPGTTAESTTSVAPTGAQDPNGTVPGGVTTTTTIAPSVTSGPGGFGGPRVDPNAPPEPPIPDPSPQVEILLRQLQDQDDAKMAQLHQVEIDHYLEAQAATERRLQLAESARNRAVHAVAVAEQTLRQDALARYVSPAATGLPRIVASQDSKDRTRIILADVTIDEHVQARSDALSRLRKRTEDVASRKADVATAKAATQAARDRASQAAHELELQQQKLAAARGPGGTWSLPIAGKSMFTGPELAQWFIQRGFPSHARAPIAKLAAAYVTEGNDQSIRGDMAFAQSVLETGSFTNADTVSLNNFAGIGHCDTCASGFGFATPELGVRAQIQLLADYAERGVKLVHPLVDRRLHGPSGCCTTWGQLTHTWATNGNYGAMIMGVYREMLYWLVVHRGLSPRVGPH